MKLCTLLITFTDGNNEVKQITTAHTFSSTDPRHYPQRRRVVHSTHHQETNRNDRSYVTVSRSTDSPQGPLGSDMIERRPTYQPLSSSSGSRNDIRQLTVQEVHLSYKCSSNSSGEETTQQQSKNIQPPKAGPLYIDYTPIDEISEAAIVEGEEDSLIREAPVMGQVQAMPYKSSSHYASESNIMYDKYQHLDGQYNEYITGSGGDENVYEREYQEEQQERRRQQQQRRGGSSEPRGHRKHKERFEEQYSFIQEESRNVHSHKISETLTKSMSYSRQVASPRRHSATTFESKDPYREDGIRLYARYDDHHSSHTDESTTVFAPTKRRKRVEVEEERYRSIAPGPPMTQGWKVPKLPPTIVPRQQRISETEQSMTFQAKKKPVVLPIDSSKREKIEEQKRIKLPASIADVSHRQHESMDFETYKREVERLKSSSHQNVTVFHETVQSPPLPVSSPPSIIPPVRIHEEITPQKIEYSEVITREPVQLTAKAVTEFPVHEPQIISYTPPVPPSPPPPRRTFTSPPPRDAAAEEEAMKRFSEKLEVLRNSKRFKHLEGPSGQEYSFVPRPQRTIEQIETIEIETEEYRRVLPRKDESVIAPVTETITRVSKSPSPVPPPVAELLPSPPLIHTAPPPVPPVIPPPLTSIDEHKRHVRVEVTEEIVTERIERLLHRRAEGTESHEKETQTSKAAPEVIETATETIFLPSVDTSTQFEAISHTVDSYTQHDTPQFADTATGVITPEEIIVSLSPSPIPDVITTESWTQMDERHYTDVSTQETGPVTSVVDSSTQSEQEKPPPEVEKAEKGTEVDVEEISTTTHQTTGSTIIEETVEVEVRKQPPPPPPVKRESSEESESHFEERIEETTTVTTDTTTTMATKSRPYESTLKEKPIPKRASPSTTTTTTAELKLKVSTPPSIPKMDYQSSDFQSSITSRSNFVRSPRALSPHVSGSNRILKIVSESASIGSGLSPFGGSTAASSIRDAREREKKEMSDLNDRLASYIEKVRFLEAQNRKLGADLDFLRSRWGRDTFNVREMYESEIRQARKIIDESNKDRDRLENEISKLIEEVATFRHKYTNAERERATDKGVIDELLVKLSAIESELTLLKRRIANLEDDVNARKRENHRLLTELQRARTEVDQETLNRIDYQNQVQTLIEELDFVRRAHDSEIRDLQAMASRDTTSENREYFKNELAAAIREIRAEYDQVCNVQRTDMESWYKLKVQEIQTQSVRQNLEQGYTKEEMKRLRSQLGDLRGTLADLEGRNSLLEKQAEELHYQIEDDQRTYESALNDRDSQIRKLRDECHALMVELQMLLDTKQTLDAEIAIYRKMLEGEEDRAGLRQLVEQVVRTQQFRETQETESLRVVRGETSSRNSYQRSAQGNVSVQEASTDGKYIVVSNTHRSKSEPIGDWKLKRIIDHKHEVVFTFPKSFVLKPGQSVKIWARGHGTNSPDSLVFNGADSFGTGNNVQTILYNTQDEERATLIQRSSHSATDH